MSNPVLVFGLPLLVAALSAPTGFALENASKEDPADLYLVFGSKGALSDLLDHPDVKEIGPYRPPFSRLVTTSSQLHTSLVDQDYFLLPASVLAELCGVKI